MLYLIPVLLLTASFSTPETPPTTLTHRASIHAEQLKKLYDQKADMLVLDARSKQYFNDVLLPKAIWLPAEMTVDEITFNLPAQDKIIIVYCAGVKCPASGWLYDKLVALGYTDVYEYQEGLEDWIKRGYPTAKHDHHARH